MFRQTIFPNRVQHLTGLSFAYAFDEVVYEFNILSFIWKYQVEHLIGSGENAVCAIYSAINNLNVLRHVTFVLRRRCGRWAN